MEPELRAKVAPFHFPLLCSVAVTARPPEAVNVEIVLVSAAVHVWAGLPGVVVFPTCTEAQFTVPCPAIVADVFPVAWF